MKRVICDNCGNNMPAPEEDREAFLAGLTPDDIARWFLGSSLVAVLGLQSVLASHGIGLQLETGTIESLETGDAEGIAGPPGRT